MAQESLIARSICYYSVPPVFLNRFRFGLGCQSLDDVMKLKRRHRFLKRPPAHCNKENQRFN